ncbi:flagellar motor switch protein FliN [Enterobacter cloacae complex sp. P15RS]|uniref:Flagellar motor switch protein FliN n=2 Tax=Enterobacter TaxID=547 RepID=A0ABU9PDY6_9ENTR|nr:MULTISPECIES: flagellar motor switch protein FliN [Enterobacter]RAY67247.1 flagellar motor switch protein FliN [Enterobacter hormaechei]KZR32309.1 flagellar motor switch protein FliN [Enterobacter genomosp. S]MBE3470984.1 flagellar motor switch protein FliN [Enterobacter cloacae complex sp. P15RS]MBE4963679.1 flagellar motor switch protein FliN [Enterobacter cloacae complex sp. P24RS]MBJ6383345.1 flagellar motor switch protein FliN [Enterobacter cloacae]
MSDLQHELSQSLDLDDLNLSDMPQDAPAEGTIRNDLQPEPSHASMTDMRRMALFSRIPVTLTLEVSSVDIPLSELMNISSDSVIELDKMAGEPLDIKVNGIPFGKAEVVVLNDKYGLRIIDFNTKELGELTR